MPLPDADPDKRIYALLKNTDLENLSFADFQGVAEKVFAEQGAEDTLRRIVLVNLARLAVAGEWNGLTTAGGGDFNAELPGTDLDATGTDYDRYQVLGLPPWGAGTTFNNGLGKENVLFFPFISPKSGDLTEIGVNVSNDTVSAQDTYIGVYSDSGDGVPKTLLGFATFDSTDQSTQYDTSLSATITLSRGTQYWIGRAQSTSENCELYAYSRTSTNIILSPVDALTTTSNPQPAIETISTATSLPSTVDPDDVRPVLSGNGLRPIVTFKW